MTANTAGILKYRVVGVQNSVPYCHAPPLRSSKYLPYWQSLPLRSSKYLPYWQSPPLGSSKYGPVTHLPPPPQSQKRTRHPNPTPTSVPLSGTFYEASRSDGWQNDPIQSTGRVGVMPIFYPSDHPSTIVRPEERHRSPSARKDELQGRARKSECPKRSVATQVFRISASAARLSAWVTVALTFFCLLFLCQDKKRRWGPVGASPHPHDR